MECWQTQSLRASLKHWSGIIEINSTGSASWARQEIICIQDSCSFFLFVVKFSQWHWRTQWINCGNLCGYYKHVIELIHSSYTYTYIYLCTQSINKTTKWEPKDYSFIHIQHQNNPGYNQQSTWGGGGGGSTSTNKEILSSKCSFWSIWCLKRSPVGI